MTDRNMAFAKLYQNISVGSGNSGGTVYTQYIVLAPDSSYVPVPGGGEAVASFPFAYADNPDLIVIFLDSPGRY
jgi:hypothetical protein